MRMSESIVKIKDRVGNLLEEYPKVRDSDKLLWLAYLCVFHSLREKIGDDAFFKLKEIIMDDKTPTMESIRRVRQKFQEQGFFVGEKRSERILESEKVKSILR